MIRALYRVARIVGDVGAAFRGRLPGRLARRRTRRSAFRRSRGWL